MYYLFLKYHLLITTLSDWISRNLIIKISPCVKIIIIISRFENNNKKYRYSFRNSKDTVLIKSL